MTRLSQATVDRVDWTLTSAGQAVLSEEDLRLDVHLAAGRAEIIKHAGHRSVYRITLPMGVVYWKISRVDGPRAWWRDFFRGPKAKMEFDRARELADRGIGTAEPLAWGRTRSLWPSGSMLITRALDATVPLDEYLSLESRATVRDRIRFTSALAEFISQLHAVGARHPDLHPGNLLIRSEESGARFFLIDLHDLALGPPLGRRARIANLVLLNRWFRMRSTRTDRLRFWKAYARFAGVPDDARRIELETERSVARLWSSRDDRCLKENRHFRKISHPGVSGFAVRELDSNVIDRILADPDEPFRSPGRPLLKDSRSSTVCLTSISTPDGPREMVYKRFRLTHWTDPIAHMFRPSAALRSWKNGHAFIARGLPTPRPWLVLHRRRLGMPTVGYLLTQFVPNASHLNEAVQQATMTEKRRLLDRLARLVRLMHGRGVAHRDLKAANILVTASGNCSFIDLVGVRTRATVSRRLRVRDLTRLSASFVYSSFVTSTDRLRFLREYVAWGLVGREGWKSWWTEIGQGTREKILQNARRNRPLA